MPASPSITLPERAGCPEINQSVAQDHFLISRTSETSTFGVDVTNSRSSSANRGPTQSIEDLLTLSSFSPVLQGLHKLE
jgi:hypothetical protein